ncbi:hypothetical protein CEE37_00235 [candidate division LCP-89 bacterium B3_LCP]|uniref:Glycosyltransferase 2-like domain-containing protein n=1 Tax=candidate division LCP-89 bacterium B3_LCP TaxID=2012998 RepID=A0A532V4P5_UNCL8|nr:MAG: hypothetical protein CEE37_00235 [candidate division LCP-89 bacterium B3_LCP]
MIFLTCFFIFAGILVYVFLLYPTLILLLGSFTKREFEPKWSDLPSVTLVFSAFNEEDNIVKKLNNALEQEYPEDKLYVIVVDDDSTDGTVQLIKELQSARITLLQQKDRKGKTAALNRAVEEAEGEVLVFTDANSMYLPDAVRKLVDAFDASDEIGVVCGEITYEKHPLAVSEEESLYWKLEILLKRAESNLGTMFGANGAIYAMLRKLYTPLDEDVISDFITPLLVLRRGKRTVYQPFAMCTEISTRNLKAEFRRKKRIVQRSLYGLWKNRDLLNPLSSKWLALQLLSHKVLRWFTPVWMLGIFVCCLFLITIPVFAALLIIQALLCLSGLIGIFVQLSGKPAGWFRFPAYLLMLLFASFIGIWGFITGRRLITWEPQR